MVKVLQGGLAALVFLLIISVWNWVTNTLPASPSGQLSWIVFLMALIASFAVYYVTTNGR